MIIPPPDIKEVIEASAEIVSKNGKEMEMYIYSKERTNPKFSFINPNDPYHMFYQYCLENVVELANRRKNIKSDPKLDNNIVDAGPSISYTHSYPCISVSALDFDLVKLTALFSSINGAEFSSGLASRELRNPQFDFLKFGHSQNELFTSLRKSFDSLHTHSHPYTSNYVSVLGRCKAWAEILKNSESIVKQKVDDSLLEKSGFEKVDWHSFVIADILDFTVDDRVTTLSPSLDLQTMMSTPISSREKLYGFSFSLLPGQSSIVSNSPASITTNKFDKNMLPCPLCGLLIPTDKYDEHIKLETVSSQSAAQRSRFEKKHEMRGEEKSSQSVKDNISRIVEKRMGTRPENSQGTKRSK